MNIEQAIAHGGAFRLICLPEAGVLRSRADKVGVEVRSLSAVHARTKEKFLRFLAAALPLPAYFGDNWDAFYDSLTDLSLAQRGELWLIDGLDGLARNEPEEFVSAVSVFSDAADYWHERGKSLTVLMIIGRAELAPDLPTVEIV